MVFDIIGRYEPKTINFPLNRNTIAKTCRGADSSSCSVELYLNNFFARLKYDTFLYINKDSVKVVMTFKKFPYIFGKYDTTKERVYNEPKISKEEWDFCQKLRLNLNNRKRVYLTDELTGRVYVAKCYKRINIRA